MYGERQTQCRKNSKLEESIIVTSVRYNVDVQLATIQAHIHVHTRTYNVQHKQIPILEIHSASFSYKSTIIDVFLVALETFLGSDWSG